MSKEDKKSLNTAENVHECARKGFVSASNYEKVRPNYPVDAVKSFLQNLGFLDERKAARPGPVKILELGSGTGKFTRIMLEVLKDEDVEIIASDPLENMCEHFKRVLPETELIQCAAENIGKPLFRVRVSACIFVFHFCYMLFSYAEYSAL